jgi:multidrug resistance efflux pump
MSQIDARDKKPSRPYLLVDTGLVDTGANPVAGPPSSERFLGKAKRGVTRLSMLKIAGALAILVVAGVTLAPSLIYTQSDDAVTNAPLTTLRPAIPGLLDRVVVSPGQVVAVGDLIAVVRNPLANPAPMIDIDGRLRGAQARLETATAEAAGLHVVQARLAADFGLWRDAQSATIDLKRRQAAAARESAFARLAAANADLARYKTLQTRGFATTQRLEQAVRDRDVAIGEVRFAELDIGRDNKALQVIAQGFTLGETDRSPTRQRIDEIDIRLANLDAIVAATTLDVRALEAERLLRLAQFERESVSELRATTAGVVWRIFARPGEQIGANAAIANVIDSARMVVTAVFRQRHAEGLRIGRPVSIRVLGSDDALAGTITEVSGYYDSDQRIATAVVLRPDKEASVLVTVVPDQPLPSSLVGLKSTVRLDR